VALSGIGPVAHASEGAPPEAEGSRPPVVDAPRGRAFTGGALDTRTEEVAALLRCPVCQGLSVADSPATMAVKMKAQVREMLANGYDEEQILSYFERSYGEFVLLRPPLRGMNWLVWLAPVLGLMAGAVVVAWALRSSARSARAGPAAEPASDEPGRDTLPADPELARHVLRVREIAYGWPGGRPPVSSASRSTPVSRP
jgi:cytochrome c-type biogenesis protein CcmH